MPKTGSIQGPVACGSEVGRQTLATSLRHVLHTQRSRQKNSKLLWSHVGSRSRSADEDHFVDRLFSTSRCCRGSCGPILGVEAPRSQISTISLVDARGAAEGRPTVFVTLVDGVDLNLRKVDAVNSCPSDGQPHTLGEMSQHEVCVP